MRGLDRTLYGASIGSDRIACPTIRGLTNSLQGDHDESDETGVDGNTVLAWMESSATARRLEVDARFQEFSWHCVVPGIPWRDGRAVCARTCALDRCRCYRFLACDSPVVVASSRDNQPTFGVRAGSPFDHDPGGIDTGDLDAGGRMAGSNLVGNCGHAPTFPSVPRRRGSMALNGNGQK